MSGSAGGFSRRADSIAAGTQNAGTVSATVYDLNWIQYLSQQMRTGRARTWNRRPPRPPQTTTIARRRHGRIPAFLAAIVAFIIWLIALYNRLIDLRNRFKNAFSQIDVQLKRRYDLIPNLVETAKAYMAHERETLEAVIAARNKALSASDKAAANPADAGALRDLMAAESTLAGRLGKLFALSSRIPTSRPTRT